MRIALTLAGKTIIIYFISVSMNSAISSVLRGLPRQFYFWGVFKYSWQKFGQLRVRTVGENCDQRNTDSPA